MPYGTVNADLITTSDGVSSAGLYGFKNKIFNGDMRIDQRNAGASVTPTVDSTYTIDRWVARLSASSKFSVQQNAAAVTPPAGFTNYLGITSLAATTVGSGDYYGIQQNIEGLNLSDLAWGTANAATVTFSFWVRSSLTGTFSGVLKNSAFNRSYPFTYTINSANTWEKETITIAGDTSGTWLTTNGIGVQVIFNLGYGSSLVGTAGAWAASNLGGATGSVNVVGTNGATFYITGVQLEKGSTATSFDYRPYGTELSLCQRYYQILQNTSGGRAESTTYLNMPFRTICTMRATPSGSIVGTIVVRDLSATTSRTATTPGSLGLSIVNDTGGYLEFGASSWSPANFTIGNLCALACSTGVNGIALSAEL